MWFWFTWRGIFTASKKAGEGAGRNKRMRAASNEAGNLWLALALNVASRIQWLEIALTVRNAAPIAGRRVHNRNRQILEIELMEAAAYEENPFEKEFFWNRYVSRIAVAALLSGKHL